MALEELVEALRLDLTHEHAAEALRRWLDEVRPAALATLRGLVAAG